MGGMNKLFSCLLLCFGLSTQALAADREPYQMVRALQDLQGQVAEGNSQAVAAQRALLLDMDAKFSRLSADVWQDPRNARAAIVHVLSGGHPNVVRRLLTLDPAPAIDPALLQGALAYVEGREDDVVAHLEGINIRDLPPALGGHVALIMAAAILHADADKSMEYLTLARLLMPGSLVEEAALRREIFVAGKTGDIERFQSLTIRYLRRYRSSIYAPDFRRRFALAIDALGFGKSGEKFALLESLLQEFDADMQRSIYLRLSRTALLTGQQGVVQKATAEGMKLAMKGSHEMMLFKLYRAGALLEIETIKITRDMLWSIDRSKLTDEENELLEAVYQVVNSVRHFPTPPPYVIGAFDVYETMAPPDSEDWIMPTMRSVTRDIEETDALLKRVGG